MSSATAQSVQGSRQVHRPREPQQMPGAYARGRFACCHCGEQVLETAPGTKNRNHCPWCLWSLHVAEGQDQHDRDSACRSPMEPIAISAQKDGEWSVVHRCTNCGVVRTNRIAGDDDATVV